MSKERMSRIYASVLVFRAVGALMTTSLCEIIKWSKGEYRARNEPGIAR